MSTFEAGFYGIMPPTLPSSGSTPQNHHVFPNPEVATLLQWETSFYEIVLASDLGSDVSMVGLLRFEPHHEKLNLIVSLLPPKPHHDFPCLTREKILDLPQNLGLNIPKRIP